MPSHSLLGPDGRPLHGRQEAAASLPEATQAFIAVAVNDRMERLLERNEAQFKEIEKKVSKKWQKLMLFATLITAVFGLKSFWLWYSIPSKIHEQFIEPRVTQSVNRVLETMSAEYIQNKFDPLERDVVKASEEMAKIKNDVYDKQRQLDKEQVIVKEQFHIQEQATAAKAGDLLAYEEICKLAASEGPLKSVATAALSEIEMFYDFDAAQIFFKRLVDPISRVNPGITVEEILLILRIDTDTAGRIAAVNSLADILRHKSHKGSVQEIINILKSEEDLRVRARLIRAISLATSQEFRPLDKTSVEKWWLVHKNEKEYQSPYATLFLASSLMDSERSSEIGVRAEIMNLLDSTIEQDNESYYAICMKAFLLIHNGAFDEAEKNLAIVKSKNKSFRWMLLYEALLFLKKGHPDDAVRSLNAALNKSPSLERHISPMLAPLLSHPDLVLPSRKAK